MIFWYQTSVFETSCFVFFDSNHWTQQTQATCSNIAFWYQTSLLRHIFFNFLLQDLRKMPLEASQNRPKTDPKARMRGMSFTASLFDLLGLRKAPPRTPKTTPKTDPWPSKNRSKIDLPSRRDTGPSFSRFGTILGPQNERFWGTISDTNCL